MTEPHKTGPAADQHQHRSNMPADEVIADFKRRMQVAETAGQGGDLRTAYTSYDEIGHEAQARLGQFHPLALDAFEGMARWIRKA